jgi:hypothetical protein
MNNMQCKQVSAWFIEKYVMGIHHLHFLLGASAPAFRHTALIKIVAKTGL